jgi:alpha-D-ribose 1-methylphosphonate 5-triphosphate diphosphatase
MLTAMARLVSQGRGTLAQLWALISSNPARALGLTDRGQIDVGRRADLVMLDWPEGEAPAVRLTLCAGRAAYQALPYQALASQALPFSL